MDEFRDASLARRACAIVRAVLLSTLLVSEMAGAQVDFVTPRQNTNVIGVTPNLDHIPDFQLKQQQEPSCIVRPGNESYILCAYNDMRASDLPLVQGDSWMGVSMSNDAGETWYSRLSPGFLGDDNPLGFGFAADPSIEAIPGNSPGLAILSYIASDRGSDDGVLAIQRWVEYPQEDRDFWKPEVLVREGADGSEGRFIDKPAMHYIPDLVSQQGTITQQILVEGEESPISISTPTGTLIIAYAVFTGNGNNSKILVRKFTDNGITPSQSFKISEEQNLVTGVSIASIGQDYVIVYRRRGDNNEPDAVMSVHCQNDGAEKCTKAQVVFEMCPFDQWATGTTFRTFSFPWVASDGLRYWTVAADRRFANDASCTQVPDAPGLYTGKPRIVAMSSVNGKDWVGATGSEDTPIVLADREPGFQVMPVVHGTKGRIDFAWYDTFREEYFGLPAGNNELLINDYNNGIARVFRKADVYASRLTADCSNNANVGCTPTIEEPVRVSRFPIATSQVFPWQQQEMKGHLTNLRLYASGTVAFNGDYISLATEPYRKLANGKWIPNNLPEGAAGAELPGYTNNENLFVAWGDNRDVIADFTGPASQTQLPYTPPANSDANPGGPMVENAEEPDGEMAEPEMKAATEPDDDPALPSDLYQCIADSFDFTHARDSNVYSALVEDVPSLRAPTPVKPLGSIQRMFPLELTNIDLELDQNYCLHIVNQPPDAPVNGGISGIASFYQLPAIAPFVEGQAIELLDAPVPAGSSASRAVFVTTSDATTVINVNAYEGLCPADTGGPFGNLVNAVQLSDGPLFDPLYCETNDCDPVNLNETHDIIPVDLGMQSPVLQAPVLQASQLEAPVLQAPVLQAPVLQASTFEAPVLQAPVLQAPVLQAPVLQAPVLQAPVLQAPVLQAGTIIGDADPSDIVVQDVTYVVSDGGNVTTTFSADIALQGLDDSEIAVQLVSWIPNVYTTTLQCLAYPTADQQIISYTQLNADDLSAVTLPTTFSPLDQNPYRGEISYTAASGQDTAVTVRIWATGNAKDTLYSLEQQLAECTADAECDETDANLGTRALISFGASAHGCSTEDAVINTQNANQPDCLNNSEEKIFQDKIAPLISIPADFSVEATGPAGATVTYAASAMDNSDDMPYLSCEPASGTTMGLGANTVSCYAEDAAGNGANSAFTVTVVDTTVPSLPVLDDQTAEAAGPGGATVAWALPVATDIVDPSPGVVCAPASGSLFPLGTTTVTCTATDSSGNSDAESFDVTVQDTTAPLMPALLDVFAEAGSAAGAIVNWAPISATDAYDVSVAATCAPPSGAAFPIGMTPVSCSATDSSGNLSAPSGFMVSVSDSTAPTISIPATVTVLARDASDTDTDYAVDPASESATVEANLPPPDGARIAYAPPASDAVTADPVVVCVPTSGSTFAVEVTEVSCTATDGTNESDPVVFSITVQDTTDPVFSVANGTVYTFEADMPGGAWVDLVADEDLHATDRGAKLLPTCIAEASDGSEYTLPALLAPGDYDVTCSIDGVATVVQITVIVDINDEVPPVLTIPAAVLEVSADPVTGTANVDFLATGAFPGGESITATDIVDTDVDIACVPASGSTFFFGDTEVTCTATDDGPNSSGEANSVSERFILRVLDTTPPTPPALPAPSGSNITMEATGSDGAVVTWDTVLASDAIDPAPVITCIPPSGSTFPIGVSEVICTATDFSGNSSMGSFYVTVQDTTAPVFDPLADITREATSAAGAIVSWSPIFANDLVDGAVEAVCTPASASQFALGTTAVTCTATDSAGRSNSAAFDVIVQDTTAPSISASDVEVTVTDAVVNELVDYQGLANILVSDTVDPSPVLACYIQNPDDPSDMSDTANPRVFTDYGSSTAICTATDAGGNAASTSFSININFPYDIELILPKGRARAGSTIPFDWIYRRKEDGMPIDSAFLDPMIRWIGPFSGNDNDCSGYTDGSGNGEDSGSSDRRYSVSQMTWQFSWQTPEMEGRFLVIVSPPGQSDPNATACVALN